MKTRDELTQAATALGVAVAQGALGVPVRTTIEASAEGWHRTLLRQVYEQSMTVWRSFSRLDVLAEGEQVVGYVDHEAYLRADDATQLSDEEVRGLVADEEVLPPRARLLSIAAYAGPLGGRLLGVTVEAPVRGSARRWLVEINPARAVVAAVWPIEGG